MAFVPKTIVKAAANQIKGETRDKANTATRVGSMEGADVDSAMYGLDVSTYGAVPGGTAAANDAAIALAITDAIAIGASLWWPPGASSVIYDISANIANFHSVRHGGPGAVRRGSDTFYVDPTYGQTNRLYVSSSGSAGNDGLTSALPCTLAQAAANLRNYGPMLNGTWRIIGAAGTYSVNSITFDTPSRDWVVVQGPSVGGTPNVPTMILDGTGAGSNKHGFVVNGQGVQVWCQDIKFQNYNNGTQNSCGVAVGYAARFYANNTHCANCDFAGVLADQGDILLVGGGIYSACRSGVISNATRTTVGYGATSTANGTQFTGCTQNSVYWSRGSQGHVDYCTFINAPYHVQLESASRAHLLGNDFRTASIAAVTTNTDGSYYDDVSIPNIYNDGTGLANAKRYDHFAYTGEQQTWMQVSRSEARRFYDNTSRTVTNAAKTQIGADITGLIPAYYFTSSGTKIRIRIKGDCPAAAFSIGIDFAGGGTTVMDYSASTGVPAAVGFTYECEIFPSALAVQRSFGQLSVSNLGVREQNTGNTANMANAQTIRIMGQSTAGTITVRTVEVWVMG